MISRLFPFSKPYCFTVCVCRFRFLQPGEVSFCWEPCTPRLQDYQCLLPSHAGILCDHRTRLSAATCPPCSPAPLCTCETTATFCRAIVENRTLHRTAAASSHTRGCKRHRRAEPRFTSHSALAAGCHPHVTSTEAPSARRAGTQRANAEPI